jgi:uncharacterized membrane protein
MKEPSNRLLLALSLALNIFVMGAAAGAGSMWYWSQSPISAGAQRGLWLAAEDLSNEQQQAFRKLLGEARRSVKTETAAGRASRDELERLLAQEPLDRAAINTELEKIRSADAVLRARLEEAVVSFAASLPVAERKLLVEGLKDRGRILRRPPPKKN